VAIDDSSVRAALSGGGGGGGDDDDDDEFAFGEDGDGEGKKGRAGVGAEGLFRAAAIAESYDKLSIGAVLAEWMRTLAELPAILRQAVTMGLFTSAQLVRRGAHRCLPLGGSVAGFALNGSRIGCC
jgi:hypothetical protein